MKKAKILLLLALAVVTPKFIETNYTLTTTVITVTDPCKAFPEGIVTCEADNGNCYAFKGSEDWLEGDIAELTISDNGTTYRLDDDKVIKAIYKGWVY